MAKPIIATLADVVIAADERALLRGMKITGAQIPYVKAADIHAALLHGGIVLLDTGRLDSEPAMPGVTSKNCGRAAAENLRSLVHCCKSGLLDGICFAPNNKASGFAALCEYACAKDVLIALEPQERGNLNNLCSTREGVAWVEQIGAKNLGLLLDSYHMHLEDASLPEGVLEAAGHLFHVHVSNSNRGAPGSGGLDFTGFVRALRAIGYSGYLSLEIVQPENALAAARQAFAHLHTICAMYCA